MLSIEQATRIVDEYFSEELAVPIGSVFIPEVAVWNNRNNLRSCLYISLYNGCNFS